MMGLLKGIIFLLVSTHPTLTLITLLSYLRIQAGIFPRNHKTDSGQGLAGMTVIIFFSSCLLAVGRHLNSNGGEIP
jgi:hypothetical protein